MENHHVEDVFYKLRRCHDINWMEGPLLTYTDVVIRRKGLTEAFFTPVGDSL
jgi:hypothetical protein